MIIPQEILDKFFQKKENKPKYSDPLFEKSDKSIVCEPNRKGQPIIYTKYKSKNKEIRVYRTSEKYIGETR